MICHTYNFVLSAPFPDEDGNAMRGTAARIVTEHGTVTAYDTRAAAGFVLRHPPFKAMAEHNAFDVEAIIAAVALEPDLIIAHPVPLGFVSLTINRNCCLPLVDVG